MFEETEKYLKDNFFSFEKRCNLRRHLSAISQCLSDNSNCSGTRELFWSTKHIDLQAKISCKFPFKYKNITYNSCIKLDHKKSWCATTVDPRNQNTATSWGYCSDSCPMEEDNTFKGNEEADKSWHIILLVGIMSGILLTIALIMG